jgi:hypothetical protein
MRCAKIRKKGQTWFIEYKSQKIAWKRSAKKPREQAKYKLQVPSRLKALCQSLVPRPDIMATRC